MDQFQTEEGNHTKDQLKTGEAFLTMQIHLISMTGIEARKPCT
jgi:hypothetical protein